MHKLLPLKERERIAQQFPELEQKTYLNAASLGPWPKASREAIMEIIDEWSGLSDPTPKVFDYWRETKKELGRMVNAHPDQIGFAYNTSHGLSLAAAGIDFKKGDEIILSDVEFPANTYPWTNLREKGVEIKFIESTNHHFDIDIFEKAITKKTKLFSISYIQFFNGYKNDIQKLGEICKERNIFYIVDGIQGMGNVPINVQECHIDLLASGAHKWLLSPVGCGFFYLSKIPKIEVKQGFAGWFGVDWKEDWTNLLRHDLKPRKSVERLSLSAIPYLQMYAMRNSIKLINSIGVDRIYEHNLALTDRLIDYLETSKYYEIASSTEMQHRSSIFSFTCPYPKKLYKYLLDKRIIASFREGLIRISVDFYNTPEQIHALRKALHKYSGSAK
jgi:selenocysteine lyase/cysteine desulfurase